MSQNVSLNSRNLSRNHLPGNKQPVAFLIGIPTRISDQRHIMQALCIFKKHWNYLLIQWFQFLSGVAEVSKMASRLRYLIFSEKLQKSSYKSTKKEVVSMPPHTYSRIRSLSSFLIFNFSDRNSALHQEAKFKISRYLLPFFKTPACVKQVHRVMIC